MGLPDLKRARVSSPPGKGSMRENLEATECMGSLVLESSENRPFDRHLNLIEKAVRTEQNDITTQTSSAYTS